jgi:hypothetical protein
MQHYGFCGMVVFDQSVVISGHQWSHMTKRIEFAIFDLVFKVTSDAIIAREMLLRSLFKYFLRRRYELTYAILYTINIIIL